MNKITTIAGMLESDGNEQRCARIRPENAYVAGGLNL
jgi:hypothetical protein